MKSARIGLVIGLVAFGPVGCVNSAGPAPGPAKGEPGGVVAPPVDATANPAPVSTAPIPPAQARYCVYDIGAVDTSDEGYEPVHINQQGAVAWSSRSRAFLYKNGTSVALGDLGGHQTIAKAINDGGVVVGKSLDKNRRWRAFSWSGGQMQDLGGPDQQEALGINSNPQGVTIIGIQAPPNVRFNQDMSANPALAPFGVRYDHGQAIPLPDPKQVPARPHPLAFAINDKGSVVGLLLNGGSSTGLFWRDLQNPWTTIRAVPGQSIPGPPPFVPVALNSANRVAGNDTVHAAVSADFVNAPTILDPGSSTSAAYAINGHGWIVGAASPSAGLTSHAFIYDGTTMIDLNTKLVNPSGWSLEAAYAINDFGQIAGRGSFSGASPNVEEHVFLLVPKKVALTPCEERRPELGVSQ
ncbi:MAG TPA: hypothetical protein VFK05_37610 [Polyangiaceae bacterium]|nr:hypothetical protein [Polyangiaceae bacterium]